MTGAGGTGAGAADGGVTGAGGTGAGGGGASTERARPFAPLGAWPRALGAIVYGTAAAVLVQPLAVGSVAAAAALGAMAGAVGGPALARSPLRVPVQLAATFAVALLGPALRALSTGLVPVASALGPTGALVVGDALFFGVGALGVVAGLRVAAVHGRVFVGLEVAVVAAAFAQLLLPHRNGAINRPFDLADPIIAAGGDPTALFLAVGAVAAVVVALLMMRERSPLRSAMHLAVAAALLMLLLATTWFVGTPTPPAGGYGGNQPQEQQAQGPRPPPDPNADPPPPGGRQAQVPVAVVVFHDDYEAPAGLYYFRQQARSQFNGRALVAATREGVDRDLVRRFPAGPMRVDEPPPSQVGRQLLETTVALLGDHMVPFGLEAPVELTPTENPDPARFRRTYRVSSSALSADLFSLIGSRAGNPDWDEAQWAHYTLGPADPRYAELARRIVDEELPEELRDNPMAMALAITGWLGRESSYSTRQRPDSEDATADYLFGDKIGYCIHFSHAAAHLLRAVGVPSRVATGYAVEESGRQGGSSVLITADRAHAWPEVYLADYGWVVTDVTPETVLDPPSPPPDPELQRLLGEMARGLHRSNPVAEQNRQAMMEVVRETARTGGYAALGLLLALLGFGFGVKLWRRVRPLWAGPDVWPRVAYRAELDRLAEVAVRRRSGESREAFAARLRAELPSFTELTAVHVGAAFGSRAARARADALRRDLRLRPERRRAFAVWRRALGWLNPFSWFFSR